MMQNIILILQLNGTFGPKQSISLCLYVIDCHENAYYFSLFLNHRISLFLFHRIGIPDYIRHFVTTACPQKNSPVSIIVQYSKYLENLIEIFTTELNTYLYIVCKNSWKFNVKIVFYYMFSINPALYPCVISNDAV